MKVIILSLFAFVVVHSALCDETYSDKFDNVDLDSILTNDRLLTNYANCVLGKGKCTTQGEYLKNHIVDALETGCGKCSEKQKAGVKKVIAYISKNKPDIWKEALNKFDPDGKYRKKYADLMAKEGISA